MSLTVSPGPQSRAGGHEPQGAIRIAVHAGVAVVTVRGDLDAHAVPMLRDALGWAIGHYDRVAVDWSASTHIDRDGLGLAITMQDRAHQRDVDLRFTAPTPLLLSSLRKLNAETLFAMPGVETAIPVPYRLEPDDAEGAGFTLPGPGALCWNAER